MGWTAQSFNKVAKGKLVVFRHGETEYNQHHWMTGQHDIPLTKNGEDQARTAGHLMQGMVFDVAYGSTLQRSFKTAKLALEATGSNKHLLTDDGVWRVQRDARLMESDTGDFTGRPYKTDPEILSFKAEKLAYDVPLPNGESDRDVVNRVREFYEQEIMPRMARGETVMLVSHASTMLALDIVMGLSEEPAPGEKMKRKSLPNGVPMLFEYNNSRLSYFYPLQDPAQLSPAMRQDAGKRPPFQPPARFT